MSGWQQHQVERLRAALSILIDAKAGATGAGIKMHQARR